MERQAAKGQRPGAGGGSGVRIPQCGPATLQGSSRSRVRFALCGRRRARPGPPGKSMRVPSRGRDDGGWVGFRVRVGRADGRGRQGKEGRRRALLSEGQRSHGPSRAQTPARPKFPQGWYIIPLCKGRSPGAASGRGLRRIRRSYRLWTGPGVFGGRPPRRSLGRAIRSLKPWTQRPSPGRWWRKKEWSAESRLALPGPDGDREDGDASKN